MTWDPYLADLMDRYDFSIVEVRPVGSAQQARDGRSRGGWREVELRMSRTMLCEQCGGTFSYTFVALEHVYGPRGQSTSNYAALTHAVEQQLRRRICCTACGAPQREIRQIFIRRDMHHNLVGLTAVGGSLLGALTLTGGGYALAGGWGLLAGSLASVVLMLALVRWMLAHLLS